MKLKKPVRKKAKPMNPVTELVNRDSKRYLSKKTIMTLLLFVLLIIFCAPATVFAVWACNPISATLCAAVDDNAWIYLNGTLLDTFPYCDIQWACSVKCIEFTPAQLALLLEPSSNVLATYVQNTNCCEVWGSWSLNITCADGSFVINSSDSVGVKMLADTNCVWPNPSPTPRSGYQWYQPLYPLDANWKDPLEMTGWKWGKRLYDPATGNLLAALSYAATMSTDCGAIWFRVPFTLTPVPTPKPPNFTITKSAPITKGICEQCNPATNPLTFTLVICNTGGGTKGLTVTVTDAWPDDPDSWQFQGPYGPYSDDIDVGQITVQSSSTQATWSFNDGFPANHCYTWWWILQSWASTPLGLTWHNNAQVNYLNNPVAYSTLVLINATPTATSTFTRTATKTITPTVTPTAAPPVLSISKSANPNTNIKGNQQIAFTLVMCNTGGYILDSFYVSDDWNSPDAIWSDNTPWAAPVYPMTAISHGKPATYTFGTGFPANTCITWNMSIISWSQITPPNWCATWQNTASIFYRTTPAITGVANLVNFCPSPTVTPTRTPTPLPGTKTFTPTYSRTPTVTPTWSNSPTQIPGSPTITPTLTRIPTFTPSVTPTTPNLIIQLIKTVPQNIYILGDTITYCLTFTNNGTGPASFTIWDTIPAVTDFVGCDNGTKGYSTGCGSLTMSPWVLAMWNIADVPVGGFDTICVYVKVNRLPFLFMHREFLALLEDREYMAFTRESGLIDRKYLNSGPDYFLKTP